MSSVSKYVSPSKTTPQTNGVCLHRNSEIPSSAIRAGASTMPSAWAADGNDGKSTFRSGSDKVRSFADIAMDPFRWMTSSKAHMIASALALGVVASVVFLF
ncbi:hypothetical protein L0666_00795 [Octadecabacter sp. CECT 8868]|uniref:hypothetical protein n=1 Tax=Octadecabacter algicola TaxID=2909342 RepID=UPI001F48F470|nr:hypothetical protein [Octadecabacter algicola]MCF2903513.1 hypothetical protein [Octadecabacter algicola]